MSPFAANTLRPRANSIPASGLPLPILRNAVDQTGSRYAVTSVDRDGRLADRSMLTYLGWTPGQAIDLAIEPGSIVVTRGSGKTAINPRGYLRLPLAVRRQYRIAPGDRVLVAACRRRRELLILPMTTVDDLVDAYRRSRLGEAAQ